MEELISVWKILLTKKGGDLLVQVAHTGQHGSSASTQPANFAKVKQIAVLHVDLVNQCLELAVIQAAGEDGVDDLNHNSLADLAHRASWWSMQCVLCMGWMCPAGRIAMLLPSRVAGRTLGLDGPEVACPCTKISCH